MYIHNKHITIENCKTETQLNIQYIQCITEVGIYNENIHKGITTIYFETCVAPWAMLGNLHNPRPLDCTLQAGLAASIEASSEGSSPSAREKAANSVGLSIVLHYFKLLYALCLSMLYHTTWNTTLQYNHYTTIHYKTIQYNRLQYSILKYNTV